MVSKDQDVELSSLSDAVGGMSGAGIGGTFNAEVGFEEEEAGWVGTVFGIVATS